MNTKIILGVIMMTLGTTIGITPILQQQTQGLVLPANSNISERKAAAPPAITGDNIYIAWWTNQSGNEEVMFQSI